MQAVAQMQASSQRASGLSGLESGYRELDRLTSGWQNSDLIIIAARPAMGKTAFVLSMAKNMAVNFNIPVAIFSLEMSNLQLVNRLISNVCEIDGAEKIKSGQPHTDGMAADHGKAQRAVGAPLSSTTPSACPFELRTKAHEGLFEKNGVKIYYYRLPAADERIRHGTWPRANRKASTISRSLKQLAKNSTFR